MTEEPEVLIRRQGRVGHITLNRPQVLNALSPAMIDAISNALSEWARDRDIAMVLIDAAGERAFCAGGDINVLYERALAGDHEFGRAFWRAEYRMNAQIAHFPKPFVALVHGIVMGGGVGVSLHGSHRIVTDTVRFAMPECAIGLIPDVGASLLLGRTPGHFGEFLGLTGRRLDAAEMVYCGLADQIVPAGAMDDLRAAVLQSGDPGSARQFATEPGSAAIAGERASINAVFGLDTIELILEASRALDNGWGEEVQRLLRTGSVLSQQIALSTIRKARRHGSVVAALRDEFRFTARATERAELLEGIRAAVIDKDRDPQWRYRTPDDVPDTLLAEFGEKAPGGDFAYLEKRP